jgi:hypothetical protein
LYFGPEYSIGVQAEAGGNPISATATVGLSRVFNTPKPDDYSGWFMSAGISSGSVLRQVKEKAFGLPASASAAVGGGAVFFWSPNVTYLADAQNNPVDDPKVCPDCSTRYGHGLRVSPSGSIGLSFSFSLTYYVKVSEFPHFQ